MNKVERIHWVDWLKTIAIYIVILGHLPDALNIKWGIYLFHMPLFFMISGYLYKPRLLKEEINKIIFQLLLPYMFYGLGLIGLFCIMRGSFNNNLLEAFLLGDYLKVCEIHPAMCPIWFVLVLINIRIILLFLNKTNPLLLLIIFLSFSIIYIPLNMSLNIFMLRTTILSFPFFIIGHLIAVNNLIDKLQNINFKYTLLLCVLLIFLFYIGHRNGTVAMIFCSYGYNIVVFYSVAIFISLILMVLVRKICNKSVVLVKLISEGTFLIMSIHYMLLNTVMQIFPNNGIGMIATALLTLFICLLSICFCKKYFPFALGKSKLLIK